MAENEDLNEETDVEPKRLFEKVLRRWRDAVSIIKNHHGPRRRVHRPSTSIDDQKRNQVKKEEKSREEENKKKEVSETVVLKVNMDCEGCARKVLKSIAGLKGVEQITTDRKTGKVVVKGMELDPKKIGERIQMKSGLIVDFKTDEDCLQEILSKLSGENLIKVSGSGKMYKGRLLYGKLRDIVAWRFNSEYGQGYNEFKMEISVLSSLQHKNISSILESYDQDNEKIIVYKGGFHGILDQHLCDPTLIWSRRLQICLGIARALNYIHYDVIHCDINTSKIFIDEDWEPKIFGFELSTTYPQSWRHRLRFSQYFDSTSIITPKHDVYSYGVLLFEVLCGKKPRIEHNVVKEDLDEIIDPNLKKQMDTQSLTLFKNIAYNCLNQQFVERPTMDQIVKELEEALELQWKHENLEHLPNAEEGISSNRLKMDFLNIPLNEIRLATNNFDEEKIIGSGGYGLVYRAKLDVVDIHSLSSLEGKCKEELPKKNKTVAIKRILSRADEQGKEGFLREIELLTSCKHSNIVSLLGFSREAREMILVYEYVSNGSLSEYLGCTGEKINLNWSHRLQICLDIANGINYLHTNMEGKPRIIHRDIKSDNILLDENLKAKIADFGLSKFHPTNQQVSTIYTNNIAGTEVYLDPEFLSTSKYKKESDIYSFGVVLFEILSGRLAYDSIYMKENNNGLAPIARRRFNEGTLKELIDPHIREEDDERSFTLNRGPNQESFDTFSKIAYQCLAETQAKRPTMEAVVKELQHALKLQGETMVLSRFRLSDIAFATENFSNAYCSGLDSNGMVYEAELDHFDDRNLLAKEGKNSGESPKRCTSVAIKRISSREDGHKEDRFFEIIEMHTSYKHPNIVPLLGFCYEKDERIIVSEQPSYGSLDKHLDNASLTWKKRLKICIDVANVLEFLHGGAVTLKKMVHRNIQSHAILLHDDWKAKISLLELCSLDSLPRDMKHVRNNAYGAFGYLDPEYEQDFLTEKSDIYSFGVVLFEILCGRLAWVEDCKDHSQSLGPLAKKKYQEGKIDELVFDDIKEQIGPKSMTTFAEIAYKCLNDKREERPMAGDVVIQLKKALDIQEDYEMREAKLPKDYKEIIQMSETPEIYSNVKKKDLYDILSKGILISDGNVWFSIGSNGERNEMVSASQFSYENHCSHKWRSIPESRFHTIAEISEISNLKIQIKIRTQYLSVGVNYGVHLVFRCFGTKKSLAKQMYVNLAYKMRKETLNAYFATWREDEWMEIELYRFLNDKENTDVEFLLESFLQCCCGNGSCGIYVEGLEFRAIDNEQHAFCESSNKLEVRHARHDDGSSFTQTLLKSFSRSNKGKYYMLSAMEAICDSSNKKIFNSKPSTESRFRKVIELLSTQEFRIKSMVKSKKLLPNTEYMCYLVFKLSEKCSGLHCPVIVRDLHQPTNKETLIVYFRIPHSWNFPGDDSQVPKERGDGWMEVNLWKFKSELNNDSLSINLNLLTYEGTMSGLVVCGLEFRPM